MDRYSSLMKRVKDGEMYFARLTFLLTIFNAEEDQMKKL